MEQVLPFSHTDYDKDAVEAGDISNFTAEEYLSWVRHQAELIPDVVRVDIDPLRPLKQSTKYIPAVADIATCPDAMLPSTHWEEDVLFTFSELRMTMERLSGDLASRERKQPVPPMKDEWLWKDFFFGAECLQQLLPLAVETTNNDIPLEVRKQALLNQLEYSMEEEMHEEPWEEQNEPEDDSDIDDTEKEQTSKRQKVEKVEIDPNPVCLSFPNAIVPTTTLLLQFDQVLTTKLLHYFTKWLSEDHGHLLFMSAARWVYSLLVRLEKPLHQDTAAMIRSLYRQICYFRYQLSENERYLDESCDSIGKYALDEKLAQLNIIIAICGKYFGQHEII